MDRDRIRLLKANKRLRGNPFLLYGLPLISMTVAGFLGIGHILQGKSDLENLKKEREWEVLTATQSLTPEGPLKGLLAKERKVSTLEEELKAIQKDIDISEWEYIAVPKPNQPNQPRPPIQPRPPRPPLA